MLDTITIVETPEGVQLPLKPAGICPRILAYLVDLLIRSGIYLGVSIVLGLMGRSGIGIAFILFFLLEWFYPVIFEMKQAATPGKKNLGLKVVHDDGTPITFGGSMLRNLLRTVDMLPIFYVAGVVCAAFNNSNKRIGDLAAGTTVVYAHSGDDRYRIETDSSLAPIPNLTVEEQKAIITFAERCNQLTDERAGELAEILSPLISQYDDTPSNILKRMAKGLTT